MVSFWLLLLSANFCPRFSDPSLCCPSRLEYTAFFPAVTLAALHKDCLSSLALLSPLQPPEPSPGQATASQVGPECSYLTNSAKPLLTCLCQGRRAALRRPANTGPDTAPHQSGNTAATARGDSLAEKNHSLTV